MKKLVVVLSTLTFLVAFSANAQTQKKTDQPAKEKAAPAKEKADPVKATPAKEKAAPAKADPGTATPGVEPTKEQPAPHADDHSKQDDGHGHGHDHAPGVEHHHDEKAKPAAKPKATKESPKK